VTAPSVEANFEADWIEFCREALASLGCPAAPGTSDEDVSFQYFNAQKRLVAARPRTVHKAQGFTCPADLTAGLEVLLGKVERGDNLGPHLSRKVLDPAEDDVLLNDWGVHHFHLGTSIENDGFVERTGPLAFAMVQPDDFYLIDVFPHGAWTRLQIVEAIHANWPSVVARYRLVGITVSARPTDADIKQFRKYGLQAMITVSDGTVYGPLGGGYSTVGSSMQVLARSDRTRKIARWLEDYARANVNEWVTRARARGSAVEEPYRLKLVVQTDGAMAFRLESVPPVQFNVRDVFIG
jgi:hypothetical protein